METSHIRSAPNLQKSPPGRCPEGIFLVVFEVVNCFYYKIDIALDVTLFFGPFQDFNNGFFFDGVHFFISFLLDVCMI